MAWTRAEIEETWLGQALPDGRAARIVGCFNRLEARFGREWMSQRVPGLGLFPTAVLVADGDLLATAEEIPHNESLLSRLDRHDGSAWSELTAAWLLKQGDSRLQVELEPSVVVGSGRRVPDIRTRLDSEQWVYVEVTQPQYSRAYRQITLVEQQICDLATTVLYDQTVHIFQQSVPSAEGMAEVKACLTRLGGVRSRLVEELPTTGALLLLNFPTDGQLVGEHTQGFGAGSPIVGVASAHSARRVQAQVRIPYADDRARQTLRHEALQLPPGEPGIVAIEVAAAIGATQGWQDVIRRAMHPTQHTRVGGVLLFQRSHNLDLESLGWSMETVWVANPHAAVPLPEWVGARFDTVG